MFAAFDLVHLLMAVGGMLLGAALHAKVTGGSTPSPAPAGPVVLPNGFSIPEEVLALIAAFLTSQHNAALQQIKSVFSPSSAAPANPPVPLSKS